MIEKGNMFDHCIRGQKSAKAPITNTLVGACIYGLDDENIPCYYEGGNLELSISYVYHAEEVALINALMDGVKPLVIACTSKTEKERIALCGNCRQKLIDANPNCEFIIFNPDGTTKIEGRIDEFMLDSKSWGKI